MRVTEAVREDWKMDESIKKVPRDGSDQKGADFAEGDEQFNERMRSKVLAEQQKVQDMQRISKKHITEFAND